MLRYFFFFNSRDRNWFSDLDVNNTLCLTHCCMQCALYLHKISWQQSAFLTGQTSSLETSLWRKKKLKGLKTEFMGKRFFFSLSFRTAVCWRRTWLQIWPSHRRSPSTWPTPPSSSVVSTCTLVTSLLILWNQVVTLSTLLKHLCNKVATTTYT